MAERDDRKVPLHLRINVIACEIATRVLYSLQHAWAAAHFARAALPFESLAASPNPRVQREHRSHITGAVLSAAAFLEAAINELWADAANTTRPPCNTWPEGTREPIALVWSTFGARLATLDKYQLLLSLLGQSVFDKGAQPYQDASLLLTLRNALVHFTPEWIVTGDPTSPDSMHRLERSLRSKFPPNALYKDTGNPFWPDKCLGYGCAKWSVQSAAQLQGELFERIGFGNPLHGHNCEEDRAYLELP